jgi:fatty acid desaturase
MTGSLVAGAIMGVAMWNAALDIVHNGSHMNIFESPAANIWASTIMGFWAWNTASWSRQHNLHHSATNHEEDPDLTISTFLATTSHRTGGLHLVAGGWQRALG